MTETFPHRGFAIYNKLWYMYVMEYHAVLKQRKEKGLYVLIWNDLQNEINRTKKSVYNMLVCFL